MNLIDNLPSKEEIERKYGKMPTEDEMGFIIHDQSSKILKIVPETWRIPLVFISHVKGYNGVDKYVLELISGRLEMFTDGREEIEEYFTDYMNNVDGLEGLNKEKYVVQINSDVAKRLENLIDRNKQQQDRNEEDSNEKKFVRAVGDANYELRKKDQEEDLK